ncbi:MAG: hypothetical protein CME31_26060 [Gimesia sp.]|uniref:SLA1 homology domain-containing protein n=1 Tax=Gimesia maris TaxID=122 RepID=A0A3D3QYY7_9PLAN|nr:hypothetical protein [Gimesia sp.]HCO21814.1 hypothetical protein [Gimesia maris]|tara:strand:+ start:25491 stop:26894 length:1404 start_codon:yes stop_codon:yes gene_type:complete
MFSLSSVSSARIPGILCLALVALVLSASANDSFAEPYEFREPVQDARTFNVNSTVRVKGQLETAIKTGQARSLALDVDGKFQYLERRLPGTGRDAEAFRSLRYYEAATATIDVQGQKTYARGSDKHRLIVAEGTLEGLSLHAPNSHLLPSEVELLNSPGDSLPVMALLPQSDVEVGEVWTPDRWVLQSLTGLEAVLKSELTCQLDSVEDQLATISFTGSIEGATVGAQTTITVKGKLQFRLDHNYISQLELQQTEKRSVGSVSPGMKVTADVNWTRSVATASGPLTDEILASIPLETSPEAKYLSFEPPWDIRLLLPRDWYVFHQTGQVAVLRLLDKGSLVSQANISKIPTVKPGEHTSEEQFQQDIRSSLGDKLIKILKAENLSTDDGRFIHRVTVAGKANDIPVQWIYYLCAAPSGRQISFVFTVDEKLINELDNRDTDIVLGLQFLEPKPAPVQATPLEGNKRK